MADVFISYAREDRAAIEKIAAALETAGHSVWWDDNIAAGSKFAKETAEKLAAAKAVVVVWSKHSVDSYWVADEAAEGREDGRLTPISIDGELPPLGFRQFQTIEFADWFDGSPAPLEKLLTALGARLGAEPRSTPSSPTRRRFAGISNKTLLPVLAGVALVVASAAFFMTMQEGDKPSATKANAPVATSDAATTVSDKSIAVLPFTNRSANESDAFFADGMHDDLLTALSKVSSMRVISRTSVLRYADTEKPIPEIAKELGVAMVMEGAVQRAGDRVRINVQLIDAATDEHLWAETYDRKMTVANVFEIQSDITGKIAEALKVAVTGREKAAIAALPTENAAAYDAYLLGRTIAASDSRNPETLARAVEALDEATKLDPRFVAAYGSKARILLQLVWWNFDTAANLAKAEEALDRARAIAPDAFETRFGEARYLYAGKLAFVASRDAYMPLLAEAPNNADLWWEYAVAERRIGNFGAAIDAFDHVVGFSPNDVNNLATLAQTYDQIGEYRKYKSMIDRAKTLAPASSYVQTIEFQSLWNVADVETLWRYYADMRVAPGADAASVDQLFGASLSSFNVGQERLGLLAERLSGFTDDDAILQVTTLARADALKRVGREPEARALIDDTLRRLDAFDLAPTDEGEALYIRLYGAALLGNRTEAVALAKEYVASIKGNPVNIYARGIDVAAELARVGEPDRAFEILERLVEGLSPAHFGPARLKSGFDAYRNHPSYKALEAKYETWRKREGID